MKNVAILGASSKENRYANKAQKMLTEYKHQVFPISVKEDEIMGVKCFKNLSDINEEIDTLTLYVNPKILEGYKEDILKMKPKRIIFNPGTESRKLQKYFMDNSIEALNACTLVLLRTNNF